jgi:hypothetical protein
MSIYVDDNILRIFEYTFYTNILATRKNDWALDLNFFKYATLRLVIRDYYFNLSFQLNFLEAYD